jgi:hypothetical protein
MPTKSDSEPTNHEGMRIAKFLAHRGIASRREIERFIAEGRIRCNGKVVSNPNIGYGLQTMKLAGGKTREFYQIGLSANTTGISVYIMGLADKKYLATTYGKKLGKASVTGYCIKFKALKDIDMNVLEAAVRDGMKKTK